MACFVGMRGEGVNPASCREAAAVCRGLLFEENNQFAVGGFWQCAPDG